MKTRFFQALLFAAALVIPLETFAGDLSKMPPEDRFLPPPREMGAYSFLGYSAIINVPDDGSSWTTYHGLPVLFGLVFGEKRNHQFGFETGFYVGDHGFSETWGRLPDLWRFERDAYLIPLLFTYRYAHTFTLGTKGERLAVYGGISGGGFLFVDDQTWSWYDPDGSSWEIDLINEITEVEIRSHGTWETWRKHTRGSMAWAAGAELGVSYQLSRRFHIDLFYRFLYAGEHKVFNRNVSKSQNHQIALATGVRF